MVCRYVNAACSYLKSFQMQSRQKQTHFGESPRPQERQAATEAHLHEMGEKVTFSKSRFMGHFSVFQTQSRHVADISDIEGSMFRVALVPRRDHNVSIISRERNGGRIV